MIEPAFPDRPAPALQRAPIQFYFDFSSPYSYIASEWIDAVAARHGRRVQWHAVLLGVLFQAPGLKPLMEYPIKRDYAARDIARSAAFGGVPYQHPDPFPISTVNAARVFWWLESQDPARAVSFARAALRAFFTRNVNLSDPVQLKALCAECGLDADAAQAAWGDAQWKLRLKHAVDAAAQVGVFGAPYFIVDGEPFWGNDRQEQIEQWLQSGPFKGLV